MANSDGIRLTNADQMQAALRRKNITVFVWVDDFFGETGCYMQVNAVPLIAEIQRKAESGWRVCYLVTLRDNELYFDTNPAEEPLR